MEAGVRISNVLDEAALAHALATDLDDDERVRAARLETTHAAAHARFVSGRAALRALAAVHLGCSPRDVPLGHHAGGRLVTPRGPCVSLSHSGDVVVVALSRRPIGVDVERIRPVKHAAKLARKLLPDGHDEDFLRSWTRLEATCKAQGDGVRPMHAWPADHDARPLDLPAGYVGTLVREVG